MNTAASLVTAVGMLLHALLGCCWHHVHAEALGDQGLATSFHSAGCRPHRHHHADHDGHSHELPADEGDGECHESPCVFVWSKTDLTTDVAAAAIGSVNAAILLHALAAEPSLKQSSLKAATSSALLGSAPIPLHLLHCVLLV